MKRKIFLLGTVLLVVTIIFGTIYGVMQQSLRQSADDPQIQLAEETTLQLQKGAAPKNLVGSKTPADSLSPFIIIYDKTGREVASSVELRGQTPSLPFGVLSHASPAHENRVTWQPEPNVRIAAVVKATSGNYVLAGRNLRETENRESQLALMVGSVWAITIVLICVCAIFLEKGKQLLPERFRHGSSKK